MEKTNRTFEEIINEAKTIADRRTKVFKQLKEELVKKAIPAFAELLKGYGIPATYFTFKDRPFVGCKGETDFQGDEEKFYIFINQNGEIRGAINEGICLKMASMGFDSKDISNKCLIPLYNQIIKKSEIFNEKYSKINDIAEQFLKR